VSRAHIRQLDYILDRKLTSIGMMQVTNSEWPIRAFLLAEVRRFVERACTCLGVRRIALVGSLTTDKENPKDADVLITVDDDADLTPLATLGRKLTRRAEIKALTSSWLIRPANTSAVPAPGVNVTRENECRATRDTAGGGLSCTTILMMSPSMSL
jgi:predicted nucleotidyltransferase